MTRLFIRVGIGIVLLFIPWDLCAQPADLSTRMAELLRYTGVESPAPEDVARDLVLSVQRVKQIVCEIRAKVRAAEQEYG